jgi:hypothetical protein
MLCKIWRFHTGDNEECRLLYIKTQFVPHRKHITSIELSRLILYDIWGFHTGDYEEWSLVGYKNPVSISDETHYVSRYRPQPVKAKWDLRFSRQWLSRMLSSGIRLRVAFVTTDVSKVYIASIISMKRLETSLAVASNFSKEIIFKHSTVCSSWLG